MPVITVSRQFGAGGQSMGELIAKNLNYTFIDNEIIQMVANKAKVSTNWVESIEKEAGGKYLKFITSLVPMRFIDRIIDDRRGYIDEEIYIDLLHKIISQIADEGNVVILGRGGQYILRDREDVFSILLIAHAEDRIKFIEEKYDLSHSQAKHAVSVDKKRRANLFKKFGKEDYDNSDLYHIVLNMSKLNFNQAVEIITKMVSA